MNIKADKILNESVNGAIKPSTGCRVFVFLFGGE